MIRKKILVVGLGYQQILSNLGNVVSYQQDFIDNPKQYQLVLFHGGADVSPELYNDCSPSGYCYTDNHRDKRDILLAKIALGNDIPMVGICRGIQFLNVFAGGKLMHHITGHSGTRHEFTSKLGETFDVTSTHHQMVIPAPGSHLIGWSSKNLSNVYIGKQDKETVWNRPETEAIIIPRINACGVQYHPETMHESSPGHRWFVSMVERFLDYSMDKFIAKYTNNKKVLGNVR